MIDCSFKIVSLWGYKSLSTSRISKVGGEDPNFEFRLSKVATLKARNALTLWAIAVKFVLRQILVRSSSRKDPPDGFAFTSETLAKGCC